MNINRRKKKASMSFWTSLGLSANNLRTKLGRTIMTAFAGSIGIIGIALILSMSVGVNKYIKNLEEDTMAEYPIQITDSTLDISALLTSMVPSTGSGSGSGSDEKPEISVTKVITSMFSQISSNDLAALKTYIDNEESDLKKYTKSVEYVYDVTPLIYLEEDGDVRQVNPDKSLSSSGSIYSYMSSSSSSFHAMPENEDLYKSQYDLKAGHWPENYNECVLVLTGSGSISDYMLYTLGLRDYSELEAMIAQYQQGEDVESIDDIGDYRYDDVIGINFKVISAADLYAYDDDYDVWVDKSDNEKYVSNLVENGEDLTIVGVVQPAEDAIGESLSSGINYPMSLVYHMSDLAAQSDVVQAQLADKETNILTGEAFGDDVDELDLRSILSIDDDALSEAYNFSDMFSDYEFDMSDMDFDFDTSDIDMDFSDMDFDMTDMDFDFDMSGIDMDFSDMDFDMSGMDFDLESLGISEEDFDFSGMDFDTSSIDFSGMFDFSDLDVEMPEIDMSDFTIDIDQDAMSDLIEQILGGTGTAYTADFTSYLTSDAAKEIIMDEMCDSATFDVTIDEDGLEQAIADAVAMVVDGNENDEDIDTDELVNVVTEAVNEYVSANATVTISDSDAASLADALVDGYTDSIRTGVLGYLSSDGVSEMISAALQEMVGEQLSSVMETYMESYTQALSAAMEEQMSAAIDQIATQMAQMMLAEVSTEMSSSMESLVPQLAAAIAAQLSESMSGQMENIMNMAMTQMSEQMSSSMETMMSGMMEQMTAQISDSMESAMSGMMDEMMDQMSDSLSESFEVDSDSLSEAFGFDMDSTDLTDLLTSISGSSGTSYISNLNSLGYVDLTSPSEIDIYPKDFASKDNVVQILDDYNAQMEENGEDDKVISYTDMVGTMMSSVTTIVNVVSYALIGLIAVSLIVSCIMISIITQISTMERIKEIGILRAMGASKANISEVFIAETFIIGISSGLIGVIVTRLVIIPLNAFIHSMVGDTTINAILSVRNAAILVIISIVITVLSGLVPALRAAKQDPVTALRTE